MSFVFAAVSLSLISTASFASQQKLLSTFIKSWNAKNTDGLMSLMDKTASKTYFNKSTVSRSLDYYHTRCGKSLGKREVKSFKESSIYYETQFEKSRCFVKLEVTKDGNIQEFLVRPIKEISLESKVFKTALL